MRVAANTLIHPLNSAESRPSTFKGYEVTLFVPPKDSHDAAWAGEKSGVDAATQLFGADAVIRAYLTAVAIADEEGVPLYHSWIAFAQIAGSPQRVRLTTSGILLVIRDSCSHSTFDPSKAVRSSDVCVSRRFYRIGISSRRTLSPRGRACGRGGASPRK